MFWLILRSDKELDFSNWPTVPQLYVKGEFIGGCDIAKEMYENGELKKKLDSI